MLEAQKLTVPQSCYHKKIKKAAPTDRRTAKQVKRLLNVHRCLKAASSAFEIHAFSHEIEQQRIKVHTGLSTPGSGCCTSLRHVSYLNRLPLEGLHLLAQILICLQKVDSTVLDNQAVINMTSLKQDDRSERVKEKFSMFLSLSFDKF